MFAKKNSWTWKRLNLNIIVKGVASTPKILELEKEKVDPLKSGGSRWRNPHLKLGAENVGWLLENILDYCTSQVGIQKTQFQVNSFQFEPQEQISYLWRKGG
jgi:hypothetical protein